MAKGKEAYQKVLFSAIMIVMIIPAVNFVYPLFKCGELEGAVTIAPKADFSSKSWFDQTFQDATELYINDNFSLRPWYVRLNNQLDYTLFGVLHARSVIEGKKNFLYEQDYINAWFGFDYIGDDEVRNKMHRINYVLDTLDNMGVKVLFIFAPGKASFYPEFLPAKYDTVTAGKTNYQAFKAGFDKARIPYLNFRSWFESMKTSSTYPLFPKCGIHWSKYGEYVVADTLLRFINDSLNIEVPQIVLDTIIWSRKNLKQDYDLGRGLNLIWQIPAFDMAYPEYHFENTVNDDTNSVLVVSDSYYWGLYGDGFATHAFGGGEFWFYNRTIYPESFGGKDVHVKDVDFMKRIQENKLVVIITTNPNMRNVDHDFIDMIYSELLKNNDKYHLWFETKVNDKMNEIKSSAEWIKMIEEKAKERGEDIKLVLRNDAIFLVKQLPVPEDILN